MKTAMQLSPSAPTAALALLLATLAPGVAPAQSVLNVDRDLGMDDGEITPDGRYGVVRMNGYSGQMRVYEMATGALLEVVDCGNVALSGTNEDGVAVTNERAVVIGNCAVFGDLTAVGTPAFHVASHDVGAWARDLEITPDGSIAAVRGGSTSATSAGGVFLFDTAAATLLASAPGEPPDLATGPSPVYALDSVAVTDTHAVFLSAGSLSTPTAPRMRVTVFELHPAGGGAPAIVYETVAGSGPDRDFDGWGNDIAISPDGSHVAVRAEYEVGLIQLAGPGTALVWRAPPSGNPGSLGTATMDTLAVTNDRVAIIGRWSNGGQGTQLDLFDFAGNQVRDRFPGDPHDLVVTPTTNRLLVRTHVSAVLYDLGVDPSIPGSLQALDVGAGNSSHTSWDAGLDSIAATDRRAVGLFRNQDVTLIEIWDISQDAMSPVASLQMPEPPLDLAITPDQSRVVIGGNSYVQVIDLRTNRITLAHDTVPPVTKMYVPWCDGVVADDTHALAFGYDTNFQGGWVGVIDLFSEPVSYCSGGQNSLGVEADLFASGSASVAANDLVLWSAELPPDKVAAVIYGDGQQQIPFASGFACVTGATYRFPLQRIAADGVVSQAVDVTGPKKLGGAASAGTTWNFQLLYRDAGDTNTTDGLSVTFVP